MCYYYEVKSQYGKLLGFGFGMTFEMAEEQAMRAVKDYIAPYWWRRTATVTITLRQGKGFTQWTKEVHN